MYGIVRRLYGIERHAEEKSDLEPDPQFLQPSVECDPADTEGAGGLRDIATGLIERGLDEIFLRVVEEVGRSVQR